MSGSVPPPPPPPPVPPVPTTVPPSHEVVVDVHQQHHGSSGVTVDISSGQTMVYLEGAGTGRMVSEAPERTVRKSEETAE